MLNRIKIALFVTGCTLGVSKGAIAENNKDLPEVIYMENKAYYGDNVLDNNAPMKIVDQENSKVELLKTNKKIATEQMNVEKTFWQKHHVAIKVSSGIIVTLTLLGYLAKKILWGAACILTGLLGEPIQD